jgi:hypothetical protein
MKMDDWEQACEFCYEGKLDKPTHYIQNVVPKYIQGIMRLCALQTAGLMLIQNLAMLMIR